MFVKFMVTYFSATGNNIFCNIVLSIYDGFDSKSTLILTFCGYYNDGITIPIDLLSTQEYVRFDIYNVYSIDIGIIANYSFAEGSPTITEQGHIDAFNLTSINYDICEWKIISEESHSIVLNFTSFDTRHDEISCDGMTYFSIFMMVMQSFYMCAASINT